MLVAEPLLSCSVSRWLTMRQRCILYALPLDCVVQCTFNTTDTKWWSSAMVNRLAWGFNRKLQILAPVGSLGWSVPTTPLAARDGTDNVHYYVYRLVSDQRNLLDILIIEEIKNARPIRAQTGAFRVLIALIIITVLRNTPYGVFACCLYLDKRNAN